MKDMVHTNQQRLDKIRGLIAGVRSVNPSLSIESQLISLTSLASEVEGSIDAVEGFLRSKNQLNEKE